MSSDRIQLTDRLRKEGRWEEATKFRDEARLRHKADGMKAKEALAAAWDEMEEAFPPIPEVPKEPEESELPQLDDLTLERLTGSTPDLIKDILWVYARLEDRIVKPEDSPTLGAWSMLKWARGARNRFFEQLLPKALAAKKTDAGEQGAKPEDVDPGIEEVERMLSQVLGPKEAKDAGDGRSEPGSSVPIEADSGCVVRN